MHIFQTARVELRRQLARHRTVVRGRVLDVGAGAHLRYRDLFECDEYVPLDTIAHTPAHAVGTAESLPFGDSSFDTILCTQVIGDIYRLASAFAEFSRVLRPGGALVLTESFIDPLHDEPHDYWRFTAHSLGRLAEDAGFKVEMVEHRGGYHSVMFQMKARYWIERLDAYRTWKGKVLAKWLAVRGRFALWRDLHDHSAAAARFTHGYLLIARKP